MGGNDDLMETIIMVIMNTCDLRPKKKKKEKGKSTLQNEYEETSSPNVASRHR